MKKMKKCKYCGADVAEKDKRCPHCGRKLKKSFFKRLLKLLIILVIIAIVNDKINMYIEKHEQINS